ncbi:MAG: DUF4372 domain-containing protein [Flavobacteriales bacterium]|nr:DUF4372 domain-containing protein [Flavobacteriales bacterium]MBK7295788.1 DUF4372 domain-containing protein [Flavobacteriales bacterium]
MGKIKAKAGTPVYGQLLSLINRKDFHNAVVETGADFAVKKLNTWTLMGSMIFCRVAKNFRASRTHQWFSGL